MDDRLFKDVMKIGGDIVVSDRFAAAKKVMHHDRNGGNIAGHSIETAEYALLLARWLNRHGASVSEIDAVRASLLHDIGMTEEEVHQSPSRVKAYSHPREGERIAREEFGANDTQLDAIRHHMWPFCCLVPPKSSVGMVVTMADKMCSLSEVRRRVTRIAFRGQ